MRRRRVRPTLFWILVGVGIVVGLQCLWLMVGPRIRHWQVERAIARFEAKPSQACADELVGLICSHAADAEQGRPALHLLLQPNIVARKTYAVGQPVGINLERAFHPAFRNVLWLDGTISVDGQPVLRDHGAPRQFRRAPENLHIPRAYSQAGTYPVEIRFQYVLGIERANRLWGLFAVLLRQLGVATGSGWEPARTYDCDFTVRTEVVVAPREEAETVELVSNPDLDRAVRRAFLMDGPGANSASSISAPGPRITPLASYIHYQNLPIAVSFQCVRRRPDGREVPFPGWYPEQFRAPAGSSGSFFVDLQAGRLPRGGESLGTIVLKPDRELAYRDPTIKAIWNGTLEFPIQSTVAPASQAAQQENGGGK
jgi:hypothetical protein